MSGLYIHIPFCRTRCGYCDFYSQTDLELTAQYLQGVIREMALRQQELRSPLQTVYIGGGTPSLLSSKQLKELFDAIESIFGLSHCKEVTIEVNPNDINPDFLSELQNETPINRLSIGVQSFSDPVLKWMGRRHTAKEAIQSIEAIQGAGFKNISIDLIYGLPGLSIDQWKETIGQALRLSPTHLSAYCLSIEEGTPFARSLAQNQFTLPADDEIVDQYKLLLEETEASACHWYEISNFAQEGYQSLHNSSYWKGVPYIGIGASAHSYNGECRQWNTSSISSYLSSIDQQKVPFDKECLTLEEKFNDYIITRLRTKSGLNKIEMSVLFPSLWIEELTLQIAPLIRQNRIISLPDSYALSPQGVFLCDAICRELIRI